MRVTVSPKTRIAGIALLAVLALAGCSAPTPSAPVDTPEEPTAPTGPVPAWYGDTFDDAGCPVPGAGAQVAQVADPAAFLTTDLPAGWCLYKSTDYTQYYAIPATEVEDPGGDIRAVLEPAGWAFDPLDDGSPQWSWITAYPESAAADFTDGAVDGAIFVTDAISADDMDSYDLWFSSLTASFRDWTEGDYVAIVGFW